MEEKILNTEHEPIDGEIVLQCDSLYMRAVMIIKPPFFGGKPVTFEQVMTRLGAEGICYGVKTDEISRMLEDGLYNVPRVIAEGVAPIDGEDGTIDYKFPRTVKNVPKEDERGNVNYKDLGFIRNITAGTVIAEIALPTEGTHGISVRNQIIPQKTGVPVQLPPKKNVSCTEGGTRLVASADGNLIYNNGFSVEEVFDWNGDVDISTGNLDFIGDIIIRGDVKEGFLVSSRKNITVYGSAAGAELKADGDLVIKKGCICSRVLCGGSMTASFIESSRVSCGGDLKADALIASDVSCSGNLTAEGAKGVIMGGRCVCLKNISAASIGSESYLPTMITAGDNAVRINERNDCARALKKAEEQLLQCEQAVQYLASKLKAEGKLPLEKLEKLSDFVRMKEQLSGRREELTQEIERIDEYLQNPQTVSVACKHELYPGVKIIINDCAFQVNDVYQHCRIYLSGGEIRADSL